MHRQIAKEAEKETINRNEIWMRCTHGNLKVETETLITACHEQAIATNYMKARIMKTDTEPKCRLCRVQSASALEYLQRIWHRCPREVVKYSPDLVIDTPRHHANVGHAS